MMRVVWVVVAVVGDGPGLGDLAEEVGLAAVTQAETAPGTAASWALVQPGLLGSLTGDEAAATAAGEARRVAEARLRAGR